MNINVETMNINHFVTLSLLFVLSHAKNETEVQRIEKEEAYRRAYHGLVVGYDCSTPTEVTSHELDTIEDCEEKNDPGIINPGSSTDPSKIRQICHKSHVMFAKENSKIVSLW